MRDLLLGALYRSLNTTSSLSSAQTFLRAVVARGRDLGPQGVKEEKWVTPFALFELAVVQCKLGSLEEGLLSGEGEKEALEGVWRDKIARAEKLLEEVFAVVEYDLKSTS